VLVKFEFEKNATEQAAARKKKKRGKYIPRGSPAPAPPRAIGEPA
jgi:hypothetical protein